MAGEVIDLASVIDDRTDKERSERVRVALCEVVSLLRESGLRPSAIELEWHSDTEFQAHFHGSAIETH